MAGRMSVISSMATRSILAELAALYERRTGCAVALDAIGGIDAAKAVRAGADVDVVILASTVMAQLTTEQHLVAASCSDVARSGIAIAVRAGAPHPAVDTEAAVRTTMLDARRMCLSTGPSGDHIKAVWQRWGLTDTLSPRTIQAPAGVPVGALLAQGEADLGFQQRSELLNMPGVEIVGPLPPEIQATTIFTAGIARTSLNVAGARALIAFLTLPETAIIKRRHGMDTPA